MRVQTASDTHVPGIMHAAIADATYCHTLHNVDLLRHNQASPRHTAMAPSTSAKVCAGARQRACLIPRQIVRWRLAGRSSSFTRTRPHSGAYENRLQMPLQCPALARADQPKGAGSWKMVVQCGTPSSSLMPDQICWKAKAKL